MLTSLSEVNTIQAEDSKTKQKNKEKMGSKWVYFESMNSAYTHTHTGHKHLIYYFAA